ncbi:hypothetical protein B0F90DRAFT_1665739 [Multifurca ochricompacta]|uniref:Uncharacterized protein n=1 Tax=Multifurca ochricompacta TaxID=376703 RepID=A0AAD4MA93_9AGAM|nr:hypothetical protein B0F90DRAFT_1665739 [Multifurca ochricompacta]
MAQRGIGPYAVLSRTLFRPGKFAEYKSDPGPQLVHEFFTNTARSIRSNLHVPQRKFAEKFAELLQSSVRRHFVASGNKPGQPQSGQQFVFDDAQSPFAFNFDYLWPTPAYENYPPAPDAFFSVPDPSIAFTDRSPLSPDSKLYDRIPQACPTSSEPTPTPAGPACQEGSQVTAAPSKPRPLQQASTRSGKKRKTTHIDSDDGSLILTILESRKDLLQCCMMVKPESLARHLKSDGHKRNAGLPTDRPELRQARRTKPTFSFSTRRQNSSRYPPSLREEARETECSSSKHTAQEA